jgi:hypothetical protein
MYLGLLPKLVVSIAADPMLGSGVCRYRNGGGADAAKGVTRLVFAAYEPTVICTTWLRYGPRVGYCGSGHRKGEIVYHRNSRLAFTWPISDSIT